MLEQRLFLSAATGVDKSWFGVTSAVDPAPWAAEGDYQPPSGVWHSEFSGDRQSQTAVLHFTFDGTPRVEQVDGGAIVTLAGEQTWVSTGDPVVPVRQSTILLPQGMQLTSIEARYHDAGIVLASGVPSLAAPVAVPIGGEVEAVDTWANTVSRSFGVEDAAGYSNYTISGYNVSTLRVFPIEYDTANDTLVYHWGVSVMVTAGPAGTALSQGLPTSRGAGQLGQTAPSAAGVRDSQSDRLRIAALVDNPEALEGYTPASSESGGVSVLPAAGQYEYVLITSAALESSFQPLVDQKISRQVSARIVTTEYIDANYSGTETGDKADKIRQFIADAYTHWGTQWVLLGGDREVVPRRGVYASVGSTVDDSLPTDMYYACLDGPWNGDGDALWGESNDGAGGGDIDLAAEVYIGRAPVSNPTEAAHFVSKTIRYETTAHQNASTAVWLGEKLDDQTWGSYSAIAIRDQTIPADWNLIERYDRSGGWSGTDFSGDLNGSPHLVNHLGHTNETYNARITNADVAALVNEDPYFVYSQGCMSGSFDTHDVSIAEQHVVAPYGAFGVVMNARYGWYIPGNTPGGSHYYALEFWDAVFNEGRTHLGDANQDSKDDNLFRVGSTGVYRWVHLETNLFGDPETQFQIGDEVAHHGEIHGTLAEDVDGDGQRQPDEPALAGQTVFLDLDGNGVLDEGLLAAGSTDVPVQILDNATVSSTLTLSGGAPVADVNVTLDLTHSYDADLVVCLISPSGTKVKLFGSVGSAGDNFTGTTLDDEASTSIADAAAPFTGTFRPEGLLSRFDGEDPNGTWTLQITDTMSWDSGTLNGWSLEIATGEPHVLSGAGGDYAFYGLAGGTYSVGHELPSGWTHTNPADGVRLVNVQDGQVVQGVDFLAQEAIVPPSATELGPVDFLDIAGLDPAGAGLWYSCQTTHQGYLTIEALVQGSPEDVQVDLYDANLSPLATSVVLPTGARIDWSAAAGQTYYFRVAGSASGVELRLANLLYQDGGHVLVHGTDGNDALEFAADRARVSINGVGYEFNPTASATLEFDGGLGDDTAVLLGSAADETAVLHPGRASLEGSGYHAVVTGTEHVTVVGQGGTDVAKLYDSARDDTFVATPHDATLSGDGFSSRVVAFRYVHAYSVSGGTDVAQLYDSAGDDTFVGTPHEGVLYGAGFFNRAVAFRYVHAYSVTGGTDVAQLYDSAGDDTFVGTPHEGVFYGAGFFNRAVAFRYVHAYAVTGGTDVAQLYDSALADRLSATATWACLFNDNPSAPFSNRVYAFDSVTARSTSDSDVASIDPAALDWLIAEGWD